MSSESDPLSTFGTKKGYNLDVTGFLGWQNSIKFDYSVVASNIFYFHPYLGKIPILTDSFQMGWNHQADFLLGGSFQLVVKKVADFLSPK